MSTIESPVDGTSASASDAAPGAPGGMLGGDVSPLTFVSLNFWLGRRGWVCRAHFGEVGRGASPDEAVSNWLKLNRNQLGLLRAAWTALDQAGELPPHPPEIEPLRRVKIKAAVGEKCPEVVACPPQPRVGHQRLEVPQAALAKPQGDGALTFPHDGHVRLSDLSRALGQRVDGLSRMARISLVPDAFRVERRDGKRGVAWYVPGHTANGLIAQHRAGQPMPWQNQPLVDDLAAKYRLWSLRRHPPGCKKCERIWGRSGPPETFEAYVARYPQLSLVDKRHLTQLWRRLRPLQEAIEHLTRLFGREKVAEGLANGALQTLERDGVKLIDPRVIDEWSAAECRHSPPAAR